MLELGGVIVSVLDRSGHEDVRLHQPRCDNASAVGLRGYVDNTLPSRCYASMMTHKYSGSIIVLSISKSVEPNEEQKEIISGFQQGLCKY